MALNILAWYIARNISERYGESVLIMLFSSGT